MGKLGAQLAFLLGGDCPPFTGLSAVYVRLTGSDITGDGSLVSPFLTIHHAASVADETNYIDVGEGTFQEGANIANLKVSIWGKGYGRTTVVYGSGVWLTVNDITVTRLSIANLTVQSLALSSTNRVLRVIQAAPGANIYLARVNLIVQAGYAVSYEDTSTTTRLDVLNCVIRGANILGSSPEGTAFHSTQPFVIQSYNTAFVNLALVVDDASAGTKCLLDYNLYYLNDRELRLGEFGAQDLVDEDPQFADFTNNNLLFATSSPLRDGGLDLSQGYGIPARFPPSEWNWGFTGSAPDIGVVELIFPTTSTVVRAHNFHEYLLAFAKEYDALEADQLANKFGRFIELATPIQLTRRWGALLGAYRPSDMTGEDYRSFLEELLKLFFFIAPAGGALTRIVELLYSVQPWRQDYFRSRRFPISNELKLYAQPFEGPSQTQVWIQRASPAADNAYSGVSGVDPPDSNKTAIAVGSNNIAQGVIIRWNNSTGLWSLITTKAEILNAVWIPYNATPPKWWIVGESGAVYISTDGGSTWPAAPSSPEVTSLFCVMGVSSNVNEVYVGTSTAHLWHTTNGGTTWSSVTLPGTPGAIKSIWVNSATDVWIAGSSGYIAHYDGVAWTDLSYLPFTNNYVGIWSDGTPGEAWVTGSGASPFILHITNYTTRTSETLPVSPAITLLNTVYGADRDNLYAAGAMADGAVHVLHRQANGTWLYDPANLEIAFINSLWISRTIKQGWAVGFNGALDANLQEPGTWAQQTSGTANDLTAVWGVTDNEIYVTGKAGTILKWNGTAWSVLTSGVVTDLLSVWAADSLAVWVGGSVGVLLKSTDHGVTWAPIVVPEGNPVAGIWGVSDTELWIIQSNHIYHTTNGGGLWTLVYTAGFNLNAIYGFSANDIWVVGDTGSLYHWFSLVWNIVTSDTPQHLYTVWGPNSGTLYYGGAMGSLYRRDTVAGVNVFQNLPGSPTVRGVSGFNEDLISTAVEVGAVWTSYRRWQPGLDRFVSDPLPIIAHDSEAVWVSRTSGYTVLVGKAGTITAFTPLFDPHDGQVLLTAGMFQLERRWWRVFDVIFATPPNTVTLVYADGKALNQDLLSEDGATAAIKLSQDVSLRSGFRVDTLTGTVQFVQNSTKVVGLGTLFTQEVVRHHKIRPSGSVRFYVVDAVIDDTTIMLRYPFEESDVSAGGQKATSVFLFGEVTTAGQVVVDLKTPGLLGHTTFGNTAESQGHGFELVVNVPGQPLLSIFDESERSVLMERLLCRAKSVHKLGFLSFAADVPRGRTICQSEDGLPPESVTMAGTGLMTAVGTVV